MPGSGLMAFFGFQASRDSRLSAGWRSGSAPYSVTVSVAIRRAILELGPKAARTGLALGLPGSNQSRTDISSSSTPRAV